VLCKVLTLLSKDISKSGITQTSCYLYLISIYFDIWLGLNKIPCLLYEQLSLSHYLLYYLVKYEHVFTEKLIVLIDKLVQIVISYHWFYFQLNSKLLSIKLRDRLSWVRSLVGLQQTLYNLSLISRLSIWYLGVIVW
jgi:hypothetical protein